uniref:Uncharacterized protein n=1 Tax=Heterosigma akashiwo TaxID=2829 RepID=A0A6V1PVA6_HETAK
MLVIDVWLVTVKSKPLNVFTRSGFGFELQWPWRLGISEGLYTHPTVPRIRSSIARNAASPTRSLSARASAAGQCTHAVPSASAWKSSSCPPPRRHRPVRTTATFSASSGMPPPPPPPPLPRQVCDLALGAEGDPLAVGFAGGLAYYEHSTWGGLGTSNIS